MSDLERRAADFARSAHEEQEYGGGSFHELHLARVVATLRRYGTDDPELLAAGWLHDVVEDTETTVDDLRAGFGDDVADLVWRLTDEPGANRKERQRNTHAKIREDARAVRVKLADRIANVESSFEQRSPLRGMYRKEYRRFRDDLWRAGEYPEMWERLDALLGFRPGDAEKTGT